ncbi:probable ARL1 - ADP-ribosylation factor [Melanopsichium pennsylvanicum]|uniref:Abnormal eversion of vulva protein 20 n=2 Tax=Melanopsichium pennsylvanicum TaxID=63383 RepID=A0AAJ4XL02_9BASI|nr:probable ARL1-ADP-ribosylation factor [Melanopsichium pennsylvanicum 4]SNX84048.1 probable ARL1 - ADP-ribosylation factor [Melanopsichium pennsylvanicum]
MGLFTIIRKTKLRSREFRFLFLGLDNAGKTTILKRLQKRSQSEIEAISPTLGFAIQTFQYQGYHLNVWDVGGQKSLRPYWKNYFEKTDAIIWVIDSFDIVRLTDCKQELEKLLSEERLHGATILIFANKQDLPGALSAEQIKNHLQLDCVSTHSWRIQPCSAYTGDNLVQGLDWTVKDVANRIYYRGDAKSALSPPTSSVASHTVT